MAQNLSRCLLPIEPLAAKLITRHRTAEQTAMAKVKIALDELRKLAVKRGLVQVVCPHCAGIGKLQSVACSSCGGSGRLWWNPNGCLNDERLAEKSGR